MSTPSTTSRAERTLATRRRMVLAAYDHFCANGYLGTTISAVADRAGVAVPTVYYTFGTKAALLGESLGAAVVGFDLWREPPPEPIDIVDLLPWHSWWADFEAAATSAEALDIFITHGVGSPPWLRRCTAPPAKPTLARWFGRVRNAGLPPTVRRSA